MENKIETSKTGRYFTLGNPNANNLIFVIHGHGNLAEFFIQKFQDLDLEKCYIVAPEGLNRYYLDGFSGRVGATWMTKEARLDDINDYLNFLNKIHNLVKQKYHNNVIVLGFSQGVATAFRWIADEKIKVDQFIICSGMIPPDLDLHIADAVFQNINMAYITGDHDEFKDSELVNTYLDKMSQHKINISTTTFNGGHVIDIQSIKSIISLR